MLRFAALVISFAFATTPAPAQFYTGNKLSDLCRGRADIALGFVIGVADMEAAIIAPMDGQGKPITIAPRICVPNTATTGQMLDIACRYLDEHPQERHWPAHYLVFYSLSAAFPCK